MEIVQIKARRVPWTTILCGMLLTLFAAISYSAVLTKNATIDEPTQLMSGWLIIHQNDYRVETVSPPLWECWAALANVGSGPLLIHDAVIWRSRTWDPVAEVLWSAQTLYETPGFDGNACINRGRAMMLVIGLMLGIVIARWSFLLGGSVAAMVSTALYCLDPNFIAHAPLIKGDVAFGLVLLLLSIAVWRVGQRASIGRLIAVASLSGIALNIKFSGVLAGPVLAILLFIRAARPEAWDFCGHILQRPFHRFVAAVGVGLFAAVGCFCVTWACYSFRYRPAPAPDVQMDMEAIYARAQRVETTAELRRTPQPLEIAAHIPSTTLRFVRWADQHHFLPQAMLAGFLYQHTCVQYWQEFLNGDLYGDGRWSYFPLSMLYKTPVCQLFFFAGTLLIGLRYLARLLREHFWTVSCLTVPFAVFGFAALQTHLNIGYRNVLGLLPFFDIASGCMAAFVWHRRPRVACSVGGFLLMGIAIETLSVWPDYIAYFNLPTGGSRGGFNHLGDSNLDWGQDIVGLAKWQQTHPDVILFAKLYYSIEPDFYGLHYHAITVTPQRQVTADVPLQDGVLAVSATHMQGLYIKPWENEFYARLRQRQPILIIGGTIYLYAFHPSDWQENAAAISQGGR